MIPAKRYRRRAALLGAAALAGTMIAALPAGPASATTVTSGYDTSSSTGTIGPDAPGDPITTAQMIARADDWIADAVPYSETAGWEDAGAGGPYREDCSGFVSMAWGLQDSLVTSTLPQVSTVVDADISGATNLNQGDALDYTADHVVLFDSWISQSAGTFYYDAEHTYGQVANTTEGNVYSSTLEGYSIDDFEGLRYDNIAQPAAPGSSSPVSIDAAGDDAAFVNTSGQVVHDWGTSSGWAGPAAIGGTARADSPVVENAAGTLVVFINTSGQVVNDWADPTTGWHGPAAIGGTAEAGSSLAMNAAGTDVSFINTSGDVVHDWGTSSGWAGPAAIGGTARAGSPLVEDDAGDTVYFINTSNQVVNDWADPTTGWHGPSAIGGTAEAGSPLAADDSGRDVVFLNGSGQVVNDWGTTSGWNGPAAIGGTARSGSGIAESGSGGDVVFSNGSGGVVNDWGTTSGWNGPAAIGGTARSGSGIAESDSGGTVVFVNTSGQVVNDWGTSSGWAGPAAIGGTSR